MPAWLAFLHEGALAFLRVFAREHALGGWIARAQRRLQIGHREALQHHLFGHVDQSGLGGGIRQPAASQDFRRCVDRDVGVAVRLEPASQLGLDGVAITEAGFKEISAMSGLEFLWLVGAQFDNAGLAHLANRHELYVFPPKDYGPGLWPPPELPAYALLDLQNVDVVRELESPTGALRANPPYRELARTPNALLLERSGP